MNLSKEFTRLISQFDQIKSLGVQHIVERENKAEMQQFTDSLLARLDDLRNGEGIDPYIAEYAAIGLIACLESFGRSHVFGDDGDIAV